MMDNIDYDLALQNIINDYSDSPTDDLIMYVTVDRFDYHNWAVAGFEKVLEARNLPFDIYSEDFFKKKFIEKFSRTDPGRAFDIRKMMTELLRNGWDLSIPLYAKNYFGTFKCSISTDDVILQQIVEANSEIINLKCAFCGSSDYEYLSEGICNNCN